MTAPVTGSSPTPSAIPITSAMLAEHNLQALVELVYVRTGNEVMASALLRLDQALTLTQNSLDTLTNLQSLHNQINVDGKGQFQFDYTAGTTGNDGSLTIPEHTETTSFNGSLSAIFTTSTLINQATSSFTTTSLNSAGVTVTVNTSASLTRTTMDSAGVSTTVTFTRDLYTSTTSAGTLSFSDTYTSITSVTLSNLQTTSTLITYSTPQTHDVTGTAIVFVPSYSTAVGADEYIKEYTKMASAFYGTPINPLFTVNGVTIYSPQQPEYLSFISSLNSVRGQLSAQLRQLSATTPRDANGNIDPTSLYAKIKTVMSELPNLSDFASVKAWVLDGYNLHGASGVAKSGIKQQHITDALVAAESTNDSQKEAVRRYMFVFEEYYKSAAGVLNKITQLIEKMAQNIARLLLGRLKKRLNKLQP